MKIGNYTIPTLRLFPKIYADIKLIYENYRLDEAEDMKAVSRLLGHKSPSGAFHSKLRDMRLYGLLESRGIKVTSLAEKLTYGTDDEKIEATNKAILNVPLWKELYSRFGAELPSDNFWVQLQRITDIDPVEAQKQEDSVRKAYLDDVSHIKARKTDKSGGKPMGLEKFDVSVSTINIQAGQFNQTIPYTKKGIELAKGFLDLLGSQIKTKDQNKGDTVKEEG